MIAGAVPHGQEFWQTPMCVPIVFKIVPGTIATCRLPLPSGVVPAAICSMHPLLPGVLEVSFCHGSYADYPCLTAIALAGRRLAKRRRWYACEARVQSSLVKLMHYTLRNISKRQSATKSKAASKHGTGIKQCQMPRSVPCGGAGIPRSATQRAPRLDLRGGGVVDAAARVRHMHAPG